MADDGRNRPDSAENANRDEIAALQLARLRATLQVALAQPERPDFPCKAPLRHRRGARSQGRCPALQVHRIAEIQKLTLSSTRSADESLPFSASRWRRFSGSGPSMA